MSEEHTQYERPSIQKDGNNDVPLNAEDTSDLTNQTSEIKTMEVHHHPHVENSQQIIAWIMLLGCMDPVAYF